MSYRLARRRLWRLDMAVTPEHYEGREQAYIKHFLLYHYFSDLIHKIASSYDEIVYIDGFAGPWLSTDEKYTDTSFGIALSAMRSARDVWRQKRPHLRMRAVLVERNPVAFKELENLSSRFPDIEITTLHGDFVQSVPLILRAIHPGSFAFLFLDPKGWPGLFNQGCSTLSTDAPLQKGIKALQSRGVSVLTEGTSLVST